MLSPKSNRDLVVRGGPAWMVGLTGAVTLWAESTTGIGSPRLDDLRRDKSRAVESFFSFAGKRPAEVGAWDVQSWRLHLEGEGLSANTVYTRTSLLSSFF